MTSTPLRWGIISTGKIARTLADAIHRSRTGELLAVGSRRQETAAAFGAEFDVPRRYGSYAALLADPDVDVVYNALPNHLHAEWSIKAAQAGKHILCEKPLATNLGQAMALVEAARYHDVFLLEAFMYRCHPQTAKLVELIKAGAVGAVRLIQASFTGNMSLDLNNIRLQNGAAGGSHDGPRLLHHVNGPSDRRCGAWTGGCRATGGQGLCLDWCREPGGPGRHGCAAFPRRHRRQPRLRQPVCLGPRCPRVGQRRAARSTQPVVPAGARQRDHRH